MAAAKAAGLPKDATPEQIHEALAEELLPPKSRLHYRKQAMAATTGGVSLIMDQTTRVPAPRMAVATTASQLVVVISSAVCCTRSA
mgnify:CR=1 FL=1